MVVVLIERANFLDPRPSPLGQLRPTGQYRQEITTHMSPTKRQDELFRFDLGHRFVGAVTIHIEDAFGLGAELFFGNIVSAGRIEHEQDRLFGRKDPQIPDEVRFAGNADEHAPACFVTVPMLGGAVVVGEEFVQWFEQRLDFLQATGDGAGRQLQIVAAQFGNNAVQRLKELELVLQNHHPQRDADDAFGNELVRRRRGDHDRLPATGAGATIALAMITAAMGSDVDFEDVAIGGAGDFLEGCAATGTGLLVVGQDAVFVRRVKMIVIAPAMPIAAALLSTFAWRAMVGRVWGIGICGRLARGGRFGSPSVETPFQLADFSAELMNPLLQISFALDGTLMLGPPKVSLLTKFDDLEPQPTQQGEREKEEGSEFAKTSP